MPLAPEVVVDGCRVSYAETAKDQFVSISRLCASGVASGVDNGPDGTVAATIPRVSPAVPSGRIDRIGNKTAISQQHEGAFMKTLHFLKAAGSIACVAFALNATAQTSGAAPSASSETVGQHVDDGTITTKVKADLLGAKNVKSTHIHVKTHKGVVSLTGTVPSTDDKAAAAEVTQNVDGVQSVKNHLKVVAD
jgi:hyperosmotically inducible periplasmic protein